MYSPTQYRISTITATGSVSADVDLDVLYTNLCKIILEQQVGKRDDVQTGVVYAEYGKKKSETYFTGFSKKFLTQRKKENTTKRFDNQLTVVYKYNEETLMNIKIFKNGNIQITGVKQISDGNEMIDKLINLVKQVATIDPSVVSSVDQLVNKSYKVALINSDFKIGFEIKRDKLYSVLINQYKNKCSFEPCIYPGVKIQYYWNTTNDCKDGVCKCKQHCATGKGDGVGEGCCKKITIAVFQSGCIIITGAQKTYQIDDAYAFICNVLHKHMEHIKKVNLATILPLAKVEVKPKVIIKKNSIIYPVSHPNNSLTR